jgi:hypothetical protein
MTTFRPPRRDHFTSTRRACAALCASVVSGCAAPPASDLGCDRACLVGVTQRYFEALGLRAPQRAGLANGARITENGAQVDSTGSVFGSARPVRWHQVFADPQTGQVAAFARYDDAQGPVLYAARLKVRQRQITEVEALVNRRGAHPFFAPEALSGPRALFDAEVPATRRLDRNIANTYFDAIEQHSSDVAPFADECMRIENGVRTTDNPQQNLPRGCRTGMQMFTYIPTVRDRSFPVVDVARGVVFAWAVFDMPGKVTTAVVDGQTIELPPRVREPKSMRLAEVFKIVDGQIHTIEAFIRYEPLGATTGWPRTGD